jgi:hypothetical protein
MTRLPRFAVALLVLLAACAPQGAPSLAAQPSVPTSLGPRPSTTATVEILEPTQSETVSGTTVHVVLKLNGARIVPASTTAIRPDEGHVHLFVNNQLVSMNYGLEQDIPVARGTFVLRAEFVAADHAPFNPRVNSDEIVFTVQ